MFQSTHPRGVRRLYALQLYRNRCFNPRTRMGCDVLAKLLICSIEGFNPRTRVGCDLSFLPPYHGKACFNPRTRVGCDFRVASRFNLSGNEFQSTHPRGVRQFHLA